jgi:hypothetical protein
MPRFGLSSGGWWTRIPQWRAPRFHGELLKLGFDVSERTVSRYVRRPISPDSARQLWQAPGRALRGHDNRLMSRSDCFCCSIGRQAAHLNPDITCAAHVIVATEDLSNAANLVRGSTYINTSMAPDKRIANKSCLEQL